METINNITQAATKAIWGTPTSQEPVSGKTGDVSKGEPYDAGNMGDPPEHIENAQPETPNERPKQSSALPTSSEVEKSLAAISDLTINKQSSTSTSDNASHKPSSEPSINPTKVKPSSAVPGDASHAQNDVRSPSDPDTKHESTHVQARQNVDDTTGGLDTNDNPEKLEGPGPRPVAEIAKEHGGDAGKVSREGLASSNSSSASSSASSAHSSDSGLGKRETEEDDPKAGPGKGLLYVRSSGLKADGGDFDATKPGAGREADRLLEQKGVHRDDKSGGLTGEMPDEGHSKEKKSLKQKIKAKLHKVGPV
ncbi:putative glycine-rich cell wall structural protein 1 protein [Naviculisporaceae sp. PSN 640]